MEWILNKNQHTKLTLEKKIFLPLLPRFKLATFPSQVRRSTRKLSRSLNKWHVKLKDPVILNCCIIVVFIFISYKYDHYSSCFLFLFLTSVLVIIVFVAYYLVELRRVPPPPQVFLFFSSCSINASLLSSLLSVSNMIIKVVTFIF